MQLIVLHIDTIAMKSTEPGFGCRRMNHSQLTNHFLFQMVWSSQVTELGSMRLPTGVPRLLIVGVGRGREDSQLVAIREAAKRISLPVTQVGPLVMLQLTIISNSRRWTRLRRSTPRTGGMVTTSSYWTHGPAITMIQTPSQSKRTIKPTWWAGFFTCPCCRTIRQCTGGEYAVIVGIVRRNLLEKEELSVTPHLNAGMDRIVGESMSRAFWTNELLQLVRGPVNTAFRLRATQSLFSALDNCRDIVQITDSSHKVILLSRIISLLFDSNKSLIQDNE